jgi:hypothetical protein
LFANWQRFRKGQMAQLGRALQTRAARSRIAQFVSLAAAMRTFLEIRIEPNIGEATGTIEVLQNPIHAAVQQGPALVKAK